MQLQKYTKIIKLNQIFDKSGNVPIDLTASSSKNTYYIVADNDELMGYVLFFKKDLRDGPLLIFVDCDGHTQVVVNKKNENKDFYLAKCTEEYEGVAKIVQEFEHDFLGQYYEIYHLRKMLERK